jgi:UDP-glucose 4-epimerase
MIGGEHSSPRTVLVTGGAGFIGSALCRRLRALDCRVIVYDDLSRGRREFLPEDVPVVEADIRDAARLHRAITDTRPDWVIHLAAIHFIPDCIARPRETLEVNVEGTRTVLDGCRGSPVRLVSFASSAAVYAAVEDPCVEDATPLEPIDVYGESKLAAERLVGEFHRDTGIPVTILRLFNAIGPNETNPHVVPDIFEALQLSDTVRLGNMTPERDYIDTRDVAEAIIAAADHATGAAIFNIGTGAGHSVKDILDVLGRLLGRTITVVPDAGRMRAVERIRLVADIDRIRRVTGWSPRIPLERTLADLITAYELRART